jgi:hypothetical protein
LRENGRFGTRSPQKVELRLPGVEVLAVELLSPSRFCVWVDHPAGVDHALCERVTRVLDAYRAEYTIDDVLARSPSARSKASSLCGGHRPTASPQASRSMDEPDPRRCFAAADDAVTVETAEATLRIPYESIVRANLIDEGLTT